MNRAQDRQPSITLACLAISSKTGHPARWLKWPRIRRDTPQERRLGIYVSNCERPAPQHHVEIAGYRSIRSLAAESARNRSTSGQRQPAKPEDHLNSAVDDLTKDDGKLP